VTPARGAYAAACAATLFWGINYSVAKRVLAEVDPFAVAFVRAVGAGLLFAFVLLALRGFSGLSPGRAARGAALGLLGIFGNQLLFIDGLKHTSAAHSAIVVALTPIFVLVLSALAGQERITLPKSAGILIAFFGVGLVALEKGLDFRSEYLRGDVLTLLAVLAFSAYTVAGKPVLRELGPVRTTALAFVAGSAAIVLVTLPRAARQEWRAVSLPALAGLAYMVVPATILAYLLYYYALARIDPSRLAVFTYLQPVIAALIAFGVAGEPASGIVLTGGAVVLGGVLLAERA